MPPEYRMKLFLSVAQFLDQEVVGWYEAESDKAKMMSGGGMGMGSGMGDMGGMMGGYGGMGGGMGGDMAGGLGGAMGGEGGSMGGYGSGGMGGDMPGGKGNGPTPKPIDTQTWDLRLARRKLNMYTQLSHALLKGTLSKEERDYHPTGKGVMEAALPQSHDRAGRKVIEALELVQEFTNEKTLQTTSGLMGRLLKPLTDLRDGAELIPAFISTDKDGKPVLDKDGNEVVLVKSFKDYSPRMQSFKKADASGKLESNTKAPPANADGGAAPANGGDNAAPPAAQPNAQPGAQPNAQPGAQPNAQPGAQPNAQPGGAPVGG
jgi:hypothetical protein